MLDKARESIEKLESKLNPSKGSHPRVKANARINLGNYLNFQYTGPLWMGSANENLTVIYDTGSSWLALDMDFCASCIQPVYNSSNSTTYRQLATTATS